MTAIQYAVFNEGFTEFFKTMFGPSVKAAYYSKYDSIHSKDQFDKELLKKHSESYSVDFINRNKQCNISVTGCDFDVSCVLVEFVTDNIVEFTVSAGYPPQFRPVKRSDVIFI